MANTKVNYHTKLFKLKYLLLLNFMFHSIFLRVFYNYVPRLGRVGRNVLH